MKNYEAIISELRQLRLSYDGRYDDGEQWWISETGGDFVSHVDCPYISGDDCLNKEVEYQSREWDDNCTECKSRWLMEDFDAWRW